MTEAQLYTALSQWKRGVITTSELVKDIRKLAARRLGV